MKISEFKRYLERLGVKVTNGGSHWHLEYQGKKTILARHPTKEIPNKYMKGILKALGL